MIQSEHARLLAERGTLQRMLARLPESALLVRSGFEARLGDVERRLSTFSTDAAGPARVRLIFRGAPVVGGHGVRADFGTEATRAFVEAVTEMAAAQARPLGASGPLPSREQHRLFITGTVVGSFGFQLEEEPNNQLRLLERPVAQALAEMQQLLQRAQGKDDDALADTMELTQPRVLNAVRTFLQTLTTHEAGCTVEHGDVSITFVDADDVRRSLRRLGEEYLHESLLTVQGAFQGFLPQRRTFEFKRGDRDEVLTGRVGMEIMDPAAINRRLGQPTEIMLTVLQVGQGRPRYILNQEPSWPVSEPSGSS